MTADNWKRLLHCFVTIHLKLQPGHLQLIVSNSACFSVVIRLLSHEHSVVTG